jgi:hypothetical protein
MIDACKIVASARLVTAILLGIWLVVPVNDDEPREAATRRVDAVPSPRYAVFSGRCLDEPDIAVEGLSILGKVRRSRMLWGYLWNKDFGYFN